MFGLVFGHEWVVAGEYARWMAVWLFFMFMNVPSVQAVPLLGLQAHLLGYEVAAVLSRVAGVVVGAVVLNSSLAAVALLSVASASLYVCLIVWVILRSGHVRPPREAER